MAYKPHVLCVLFCRYYMYYYPWSTFLVGCAIVSTIQVFVYSFIGFVSNFLLQSFLFV